MAHRPRQQENARYRAAAKLDSRSLRSDRGAAALGCGPSAGSGVQVASIRRADVSRYASDSSSRGVVKVLGRLPKMPSSGRGVLIAEVWASPGRVPGQRRRSGCPVILAGGNPKRAPFGGDGACCGVAGTTIQTETAGCTIGSGPASKIGPAEALNCPSHTNRLPFMMAT